MTFFSPDLQRYVESHTSEEPPLLKRLDRETNLKALYPRMISGHLQGRILSMFSKMIKPQRILEVGTFTGYSAICLVEGLQQGGELITVDKNQEIKEIASNYFEESGTTDRINLIIGDAKKIIPRLDGVFDLVYLDADKENYAHYYDLLIEKVVNGGYILADNVLWYGKVLQESPQKSDRETRGIKEFNQKVQLDERVENILLPIRDGLMLLRKNL